MVTTGVRILIVDDEDHIREMLQRILARNGYTCVGASSAADAADLLQIQRFDLLLLDITMPGKSGIEFLSEVHEEYPDLAVMMMTAVIDTSTAVSAMRGGAYDYITKPFNFEDVLVRVEKARKRRHLEQMARDHWGDLEKRVKQQATDLREMTAWTVERLVSGEDLEREPEDRWSSGSGRRQRSDVKGIGGKILRTLRGKAR